MTDVAVKSVIAIDVDDSRFKAFSALYEKYEAALAKAPGKWAEINKQIDTGGKTFQALTAAILAQTETLSNIIAQQKGVTYEVEKQSRAWQNIAKWGQNVSTSIHEATRNLIKWVPIAGLLGGGSLYGIDKLAETVGSGRRLALGLGTTYGEQKAFAANFSRLVDPESFLSGVANAKLDVRQRTGLLASGLTQQDLAGDTAQTATALLGQLKRLADTTNPQLYGNVIEARRLGNFVSPQDLQRLRNTSPQEFQQLVAGFGRDQSGFNLPPDVQKAWQDLATQLTRAGQGIENTFVKGLVLLAPAIEHVSKAFEDFVKAALASPKLGEWISSVAQGFERLAELISSPDKLKDAVFGKKDSDSIIDRAVRGAVEGDMSGVFRSPLDPRGIGTGLTLGSRAKLSTLDPDLQTRLTALLGSVPPSLGIPSITSGARSEAQQEALRAYARTHGGLGPDGYPVAMGTSEHQTGRAADVSGNPAVMAYLHQHAREFGLEFPMKNDPVHVHIAPDDKYRDKKVSVEINNNTGGNAIVTVNGLKN